MALSIGLGTISGQVPSDSDRSVADVYREILDVAATAESVGFDALWFSEHHGAADSHLPSPIVMIAAVAAVTERIRLGSAIALGPFQHPLRFAEDCAVVDQLSRGRLVVGIGSGWLQEEFDKFGIPRAQRVGRTLELARICRAAWDEPRFSFDGRYFSYRDVAVTPKPVGHLPIIMGGGVPAAAARAGGIADGFIAGPQTTIDAFRTLVDPFDAAAREAGRDPHALTIGVQLNCWVSEDGSVPRSVRRAMWHKMGTSLRWHAGERVGSNADLPALDEEVIASRTVAGTPGEILAALEPWLQAFGDREFHLMFRLHHAGLPLGEIEAALRLFGSDVIPALRGFGSGRAIEA